MDTRAEKSLAIKKDIDKKLSERTGIPLQTIQENTSYIIKRLVQLQQSEECFRIHLSGKLGYMYSNQNMLAYSVKRIRKFQDNEGYRSLVRKLKTMGDIKFVTPTYKIRVLKPPRINRKYFKLGMRHSELEKFQNNIFNEQNRENI